MSNYTIRILEACPELGLHPGDLVTFEPELRGTDFTRLFVHRPLPDNVGAVLAVLESGGAELITPDSTVSEFAAAAAEFGPQLRTAAQGIRARGHLSLLT